MLKRSQSTFIIPGPYGVKHTFSVIDEPRDWDLKSSSPHAPPPQVVVTYGNKTKAFGRGHLAKFDYHQALALLDREFGLVRPFHEEALEVTFYRKGGSDSGLMVVDHNSWGELLSNVTRIDVEKPKAQPWLEPYQYYILTAGLMYLIIIGLIWFY